MRIVGILGMMFALAIGSGLAFLAFESAHRESGDYRANVDKVRAVQRLEATLSLTALQPLSPAAREPTSDPMAPLNERLATLKEALRSSDLASTAVPSSLNELLLKYLDQLDQKQQAIERFGANLIAVRRALAALPEAAALLTNSALENDNQGLADQVTGITAGIDQFAAKPSQRAQMRLFGQLDQLNLRLQEFPEPLLDPLSAFLSDGKLVLQHAMQLTDLATQVVEQRAAATGDELLQVYRAFHRQHNRLTRQYRLAFQAAAGLAAGLLLVFALLLIVAAGRREDQLERAVATRTRELAEQKRASLTSAAGGEADSASLASMAATLANQIDTPLEYIGSNIEALQSSTSKVGGLKQDFDTLAAAVEQETDLETVQRRVSELKEAVEQTWHQAMVDDLSDILLDMDDGVRQITETVHSLRDFTGVEESERDWFQLNDCVTAAIESSAATMPDGIKVNTNLGKLPPIYGSSTDMVLVFRNLLANAVDALQAAQRDNPSLTITTRKEREGVSVQVLDNGSGMDAATEQQVFAPFFTTKEIGKGVGLGLSIVKRIVDSHGGRLVMKTIVGKGSNFKVTLPRRA